MFFTLAPVPDQRFLSIDKIGNYYFSHDSGWSINDGSWQKGYFHKITNNGNFLRLSQLNQNEICLEHDAIRGFPLWWNNHTHTLTNLLGSGLSLWNDKTIKISNFCLKDSTADNIDFGSDQKLTMDQAADQICENLISKATDLKNLYSYTPKKILLTGGVDTVMLYSALKYTGIEFETIDYEYIKHSQFVNKHLKNIQEKHWAYKQIHHWKDDTVLVSGTHGDECMMRGPEAIALWTTWHNVDFAKLINETTCAYHFKYFLRHKNIAIFDQYRKSKLSILERYKLEVDIKKQIFNLIGNDYQHWHLDNTITWTPLKDVNLLKICLNLNQDDLINQMLDAQLSKIIIKKLYPGALKMLGRYKNIND